MKKSIFGMIIPAILAICLAGCSTDSGDGGGRGGSLYAGKKTESPSLSVTSLAADVPLDEFSIKIATLRGASTETGYNDWSFLPRVNGNRTHVIPITSELRLGDLSGLRVRGDNDFCDYVGFDASLLYNGNEIDFPESMFIKGEILAFYQNPADTYGRDNTKQPETYTPSRTDWKSYKIIFDNYPKIPDHDWDESDNFALYDDFVVLPFDGIDLTRKFDVKFEWDTSILIQALQGAKDAGNYNLVQDRTKSHIKKFFESLALKISYVD